MNSRSKVRLMEGGRRSREPSRILRVMTLDLGVPTSLPAEGISCCVYRVSRSESSGRIDQSCKTSGRDRLGYRSKRPTKGAVLKAGSPLSAGSPLESPSAAASYDQ